jgi:VanZ family protein
MSFLITIHLDRIDSQHDIPDGQARFVAGNAMPGQRRHYAYDSREPAAGGAAVPTLLRKGELVHRFFRLAAPSCLVLLAILSWLPANEMIRTGVDGRIEHFIAYMSTTLFVLAAYSLRLRPGNLTVMLIGYAGILELGQYFSPGRHPSLVDFAASSLGVTAGAALFQLVYQLSRSAEER